MWLQFWVSLHRARCAVGAEGTHEREGRRSGGALRRSEGCFVGLLLWGRAMTFT